MPCIHIHVTGIVQGVGYRPFVWKAAQERGVLGWVRNASDGVHIEARADQDALDSFVLYLSTNKPTAARVDTVRVERMDQERLDPAMPTRTSKVDGMRVTDVNFKIVSSDADTDLTALISPDIATCPQCLAEMNDPTDRRYHYPFINCTNCGPRFTIIRELPYDRDKTSMSGFAMCPECAAEYADPADRRFHAQPDACFGCGPHLSWRTASAPSKVRWGTDRSESDRIIVEAATLIKRGGIVAVKGLGGFHLVCDATNPEAVMKLRERKHRPTKPLAVMCPTYNDLRLMAHMSTVEQRLVLGSVRPIVLLAAKPAGEVPTRLRLAPGVAGDLPEVGVMLPYTPLQHLLLGAVGRPLVMTSGNLADEPIICDDQVAVSRLMDVADAWLGNDRPILARYDDSVVRVVGDRVMVVRRARGLAPTPVHMDVPPTSPDVTMLALPHQNTEFKQSLEVELPGVLACGPEQKSTFTITRGEDAFVSAHIGDLADADTFDAWETGVRRYGELFGLDWGVLACDKHPEYLSSKWARRVSEERDIPLIEVQHHHAHIAATLAENSCRSSVVGIALDGTGYGDDGTIWGGEVLVCDQASYARAVHLATWRLPGGEAAIRKPLRNAWGLLDAAGLTDTQGAAGVMEAMGIEGPVVRTMMERDLNCPLTSSAGRLFDAVAAMLGLVGEAGYDGEPACLLEAAAMRAPEGYAEGMGEPLTDSGAALTVLPAMAEKATAPATTIVPGAPADPDAPTDVATPGAPGEAADPDDEAPTLDRGSAAGAASDGAVDLGGSADDVAPAVATGPTGADPADPAVAAGRTGADPADPAADEGSDAPAGAAGHGAPPVTDSVEDVLVFSASGETASQVAERYALRLRPARSEEKLDPQDASLVLDQTRTIRAILADKSLGVPVEIIARRFHDAVADAMAQAAVAVARSSGLQTVALGGGVWCNRLLLERARLRLEEAGMTVLIPRDLPVNDGAVSYGQAAVARARLALAARESSTGRSARLTKE